MRRVRMALRCEFVDSREILFTHVDERIDLAQCVDEILMRDRFVSGNGVGCWTRRQGGRIAAPEEEPVEQGGGCADGGDDQWRVLVQQACSGKHHENACECARKGNQRFSVADRSIIYTQEI